MCVYKASSLISLLEGKKTNEKERHQVCAIDMRFPEHVYFKQFSGCIPQNQTLGNWMGKDY